MRHNNSLPRQLRNIAIQLKRLYLHTELNFSTDTYSKARELGLQLTTELNSKRVHAHTCEACNPKGFNKSKAKVIQFGACDYCLEHLTDDFEQLPIKPVLRHHL